MRDTHAIYGALSEHPCDAIIHCGVSLSGGQVFSYDLRSERIDRPLRAVADGHDVDMSVEDKAALLRYVLRNLNIDAYNIFNTSAQTHRVLRAAAMTTWREAVAAA